MYYKALQSDQIVDAYDGLQFVRYDERAKMILRCSEDKAQGIIERNGNCIYHVDGWPEFPEEAGSYATITLKEIGDKDTYIGILEALEANAQVPDQPDPAPEEEPVGDLEFIRQGKITSMSAACEKEIIAGIDTTLADGKEYHFSLTVEEQLALRSLETRARNGEAQLPYHADGEKEKFYTAADILTICKTADAHIDYQRAYFNSLKTYLQELQDVKTITTIQYGNQIPEEYQSDVLKAMLSGNMPENDNISAEEALTIITGGAI